MHTGRGAIYRQMKELPEDERVEYLVSLGFTQDQAQDFAADYKVNTRPSERKAKSDEAFKNMMERMRARCEGRHEQTGRTT